MSSTNKTAKLELSQFLGTDKPAWLGDYNSDMQKIDDAFADLEQGGQSSAADIAALQQKDEELTQNINDVNDRVDTAFADVITLGNRTTVLEGNYDTMHHELVLNEEKIEEVNEQAVENKIRVDRLTGYTKNVYLDAANGNDSNTGLTADSPVKTCEKVEKLLLDRHYVILYVKAGTQVTLDKNFPPNIKQIVKYGDGNNPVFICSDSRYLRFVYGLTIKEVDINTNGNYLQIAGNDINFQKCNINATSGYIDFLSSGVRFEADTTIVANSRLTVGNGIMTGLDRLPSGTNIVVKATGGIVIEPTTSVGTVTAEGGVVLTAGKHTI